MKKLIYTILAGTTALASCQKELELNNPNTIQVDQFWKTATDAKLGTNAVYGSFYRIGAYARWIHFNLDLRSDEGTSFSPWLDLQNWQKFLIVNYNFDTGIMTWHDHYEGIFRANQVIANVPAIEMDEALKARYIGEAKFIRALYYFNLTSLWGNVPLQLEPSNTTDRPAYATQQQVWEQIIKDLDEAIPGLPEEYGGVDKGRATKGAAYALLGKTYLQQKKYAEAKTAFEWLVEGAGKSYYDLVPNYQDNFTHLNENNRESVFEIQFGDQNVGGPDVDAPGSGVGSQRAQFFGPRGVGWSDGQARRFLVGELSKEKTVDGERDPRLAASILYDSTDVRGPEFTMIYGRTYASRYPDPNADNVWFRKYSDDYWRDFSNYYSPINFRVIRFADVLLMYAECLNALGQTGQAYPYVDRVRERANLPKLSVAKPGLSQADFLTQLKHERLCELSGEGTRWNDLVRWGELSDPEKVKALAAHDADFNNFVVGKHIFLPIPQSELDLNPNLKQNPGY
ncbi:MAG: RagB/SusD family nutrient uptake outer membrane protein [Mucilaginibacter polytrichastri]|nr:RagB/SusD family nutrient uptake outer membrane protein [Mucilaginibacter polytrichastri]